MNVKNYKLHVNGGGIACMDNEIGDGNKLIYGGGPKFGKLKTLYTNIESIHNKMDEFKLRIVEYKPDLICITESWDRVGKEKEK